MHDNGTQMKDMVDNLIYSLNQLCLEGNFSVKDSSHVCHEIFLFFCHHAIFFHLTMFQ